jgi:hypothetical protein
MEGVSVEEEHEQGEDAMEDDDGGEIGVDALTKRLAGEVDQLMARGESDATEELLEKAVEENPGQVGEQMPVDPNAIKRGFASRCGCVQTTPDFTRGKCQWVN